MERRSFMALAGLPLFGGDEAEPSAQPWMNQFIAREMESSDGRKRLVNAAEWAMNKAERDGHGVPRLYRVISEVLIQVRERSGPLDSFDRTKHVAILERCALGIA
jgi:hypothetical protein